MISTSKIARPVAAARDFVLASKNFMTGHGMDHMPNKITRRFGCAVTGLVLTGAALFISGIAMSSCTSPSTTFAQTDAPRP